MPAWQKGLVERQGQRWDKPPGHNFAMETATPTTPEAGAEPSPRLFRGSPLASGQLRNRTFTDLKRENNAGFGRNVRQAEANEGAQHTWRTRVDRWRIRSGPSPLVRPRRLGGPARLRHRRGRSPWRPRERPRRSNPPGPRWR